jgi:hypothetical protein
MEETDDSIALKVQALSDLELAVLICLVADQHCIIETERSLINDVEEELRLVGPSFKNFSQCKELTMSRSRRMYLA